jgi:hypothetical protein
MGWGSHSHARCRQHEQGTQPLSTPTTTITSSMESWSLASCTCSTRPSLTGTPRSSLHSGNGYLWFGIGRSSDSHGTNHRPMQPAPISWSRSQGKHHDVRRQRIHCEQFIHSSRSTTQMTQLIVLPPSPRRNCSRYHQVSSHRKWRQPCRHPQQAVEQHPSLADASAVAVLGRGHHGPSRC